MRVCKYVLTLLNESTKNVCPGPKIKLTSMCVQSTFIFVIRKVLWGAMAHLAEDWSGVEG